MTGIGFIGGGAILKDGATVRGTSTAAAIWITGAVGAAVAWYRIEIALALTVLNFASMRLAGSLKSYVNQDHDRK
nr:MgtC/SapB family protein [Thiohalobacter thiocyanaticus]